MFLFFPGLKKPGILTDGLEKSGKLEFLQHIHSPHDIALKWFTLY